MRYLEEIVEERYSPEGLSDDLKSLTDEEFSAIAGAASDELDVLDDSFRISNSTLYQVSEISLTAVSLSLLSLVSSDLFGVAHFIPEASLVLFLGSAGAFSWSTWRKSKQVKKLTDSASFKFLKYLSKTQPKRYAKFENERLKLSQKKGVSARKKKALVLRRAKAAARLKREEEALQLSLETINPYVTESVVKIRELDCKTIQKELE